ncbi:succinate dehydrogenase cytochrome b558 subunit [Caldibacillus lycopersici]|uniref:Succinate dehydrogenase cytochrome b558 subunit n=1 Tax=Perspicuibacillus lycopersici TaxID=1325689 RepID=A0AAE3IT57_9BACI|nr:succinate dehydrogenase cytochrome b558 subunit [Perspicuibacillus lycopersici]MCU9614135.1 succinate dehydrogenase cytochrome b558 subunit [Perspicuibacillus lycopersici]
MAKNREFLNRRLHSLLGVIPVGVFLTLHLVVNYSATKGVEAFNSASKFMESLPFLLFLEIFIIYIPILYHAIYGVYIAFTAKNNLGRFSTFRNWMFVLQRFTGVFLIIFIAWHVWETRLAKAFGSEVNFDMMANILDNPFMLAFYIIGVLSATFHFANGLWSFCVSWGITISPRSQVVTTYVTLVIFVILSVIGVRALLAFI